MPLQHLSWAAKVWSEGSLSHSEAQSCAIRVLRGTDADDDAQQMVNLNRGGYDFTHPLLISTYGTGNRPHITFPAQGQSGILRPGASAYSPGDFIYVNGLFLEDTYTGDRISSVGIHESGDDNHVVVTDCVIKGFWQNVVLDPYLNLSPPHGQYWSLFRNIIVDATGNSSTTGKSVGLFGGNRGGLVISQNVFDHNGYYHTDSPYMPYTDGESHDLYLAGSAPFVWGNAITQSGGYGTKSLGADIIYGNVMAENPLGSEVSGDPVEGGGRIARNYFERNGDVQTSTSSSMPTGWSPRYVGHCGPAIMELNCCAQATGTNPEGPVVEMDHGTVLTGPDANGGFEGGVNGSGQPLQWTVAGDPVTIVTSEHNSTYGGSHSAKIDGSSGSTTLTHNAIDYGNGQPVTLHFFLKASGGTSPYVVFSLDGTTIHTFTALSTSWTEYTYDTFVTANMPALGLSLHDGGGTLYLDDVRLDVTPAPCEVNPEILVRNNTTRDHGYFGPFIGKYLYPMMDCRSNSWDSRGTDNAQAMYWNPGTLNDFSMFASNFNAFKSGDTDPILVGPSDPPTPKTLLQWKSTPYSKDSDSVEPTAITYPTSPYYYDLGNYGHDYISSSITSAAGYYSALRARQIGDYSQPLLYDFLSTAATMIGANEATSTSAYTGSTSGPMPYFGSGDGSEPQLP